MMSVRKLKRHLLIVVLLAITKLVSSAPKSWPYMKNYDIWGGGGSSNNNNTLDDKPHKYRALYSDDKLESAVNALSNGGGRRKAKGEREREVNLQFPNRKNTVLLQ
jgi:hypothetical protein